MIPAEPHARHAGLVYVTTAVAGYRRQRAGRDGFSAARREGLSAHEASVLAFLTRKSRAKKKPQPLANGAAGALGPTTKLGSSSNPG